MKKTFALIVCLGLMFMMIGCEGTPGEAEVTLRLNPGIDTIEINSDFVDAGVTVEVNGRNRSVDTVDNQVDTSTLGEYTVTYTMTYDAKTYSIVRYVNVIDETPPVITINPGVDTIFVGDQWTDAGATVEDNSLETLDIVVGGEVDINQAGTYEITYTATDSSDNTSSVTRFVVVNEQD
jgi:hypothetical protein